MNKIIKNSVIIGGATGLTLLVEYLFQSYLAWKFTISQFGTFAAVYSLLFILSTLTCSGLVLQTTKHVVRRYRVRETFSASLFISLVTNAAIGVVLVVTSFIVTDLRYFLLILPISLVAFALPYLSKAILYGLEDYTHHAAITILEVVGKLVFAIILISYFNSIIYAFVSFIAADVLVIAVSFFWVRRSVTFKLSSEKSILRKLLVHAAPMTVIILLATSFLRVDTVLIKFLNSNLEAGFYSVASLFSRTIFYLLSAIPFVIFPMITSLNKREIKLKLRGIIPPYLVLIVIINILTFFFIDIALKIFFPKYVAVALLTKILVLSMSIFSVSSLLLTVLIAQEEYRKAVTQLFIANILLVLFIVLFRSYSTYGYALASLLSSSILLIFLCLSILALFQGKRINSLR